jgi:hypothetical protein
LPRHVLPVPRHEIGDRTGNRRQYRGTAWAIESKAEWEKVGLIVCGANIDAGRYSELLARGQTLADATTNTD